MKTILLPVFLLFPFIIFCQYTDTVSCNGGSFEYILDYDQQTCTSSCNGNYNIIILNGVGPYTYSVTGNSYTSTTETDSSLCPGNFTASVTDVGQGITCDQNFDIVPLTSNNYSLNITNPTSTNPCNGYAEIIVTGGVPPYSYQWYDSNQLPIPGETEFFMDSLCNGTYYVQFWDSTPPCGIGTGGCGSAGFGLIMVAIYDPIQITVQGAYPPSCPGNCDGYFSYTISGGTGNYTCNTEYCGVQGMICGGGPFTIIVTDDLGNYGSEVVDVPGFPDVLVMPYPTNETCQNACDGSIYFNYISGLTPENYSIDGGITWQSSPSFSDLCAGTYSCNIQVMSPSMMGYCDIHMTDVIVYPGNNTSSGTEIISTCDSYTWIDGNTYTSSTNTPTWTLTNQAGCDSIVTLNLTILNNGSDTTAIACDSFDWYGTTYTSSGTPTHTFTNIFGCDSIVTLNLTINNSDNTTDNINACDSHTWIDGNTYTASTNTPTWTLTNQAGCDSVVTLNLTILNSSTGTDVITACDSYTWIDGNTYTASTNTPAWALANQAGCDSVVTLNLTINNSPDVEIAGDTASCENTQLNAGDVSAGNQYLWNTGDTTHAVSISASGTYFLTVTDINGCTGIDTEVVTIYNNPFVDLGPDSILCAEDQIILDAGYGLYSTYWWSTNQASQFINIDSTGIGYGSEVFWVEVTDSNGCYNSDTIMITFVNCTGINDIADHEDEIMIYPNPTAGKVTIFYKEDIKTEILNNLGQVIFETESKEIDFTHQPGGIYYLRIHTSSGIINGKIIRK